MDPLPVVPDVVPLLPLVVEDVLLVVPVDALPVDEVLPPVVVAGVPPVVPADVADEVSPTAVVLPLWLVAPVWTPLPDADVVVVPE